MTIQLINKIPTYEPTPGGSTYSGSIYPVLEPAHFGIARNTMLNLSYMVPGFNKDGDSIQLPRQAAPSIVYFDNAGGTEWSYTAAQLSANADVFIGILYDQTENLVYAVVADTGVTPYRFYLVTVNEYGAITAVGNAQPSLNFTTLGNYVTTLPYSGATGIYRDPVTTHINVLCGTGGGIARMVLNSTTGALVSDPGLIVTTNAFQFSPGYLTAAGFHVGGFWKSDVYDNLGIIEVSQIATRGLAAKVLYPLDVGLYFYYASAGLRPVHWGDYVKLAHPHATYQEDPYIANWFLKTDFEAWADALGEQVLGAI